MGYIKAKNSEKYIKASIRQIKENVVKVTAEKTLPDMSNGFCFFSELRRQASGGEI